MNAIHAETLSNNLKRELLSLGAQIDAVEVRRTLALKAGRKVEAQELVVSLSNLRNKLGYVEYLCRDVPLGSL